MIICKDVSLSEYHFNADARNTTKYLTRNDLDRIDDYLLKKYPHGMTDEDINNFFFIEIEKVAHICGYDNWETLVNDNTEKWQNLL